MIRYWADHQDSFTFAGNVYTPLRMLWTGLQTSVGMPTSGSTVALSNVANQVVHYLNEIDPSGMAVILQLLHIDLLSSLTKFKEGSFKILSTRADMTAAVFTLGRELGKNRLPRRMILADEMQ